MKGQKPSIADLNDPRRFEIIADVAHSEILRFVQQHLRRFSWVTGLYGLVNVTALGFVVLRCMQSGLPALDALSTVCLGMALAYVLLLPVHEHVHAFAYRLAGAGETRVRYNPRRLTAFCEAPGAVVSGGEYTLVCLAPFLVLNPILAVLAFSVGKGKLALLITGGLLLHIGACSGDIALVNFVWLNRGRASFTYDDAGRERGRFFRSVA